MERFLLSSGQANWGEEGRGKEWGMSEGVWTTPQYDPDFVHRPRCEVPMMRPKRAPSLNVMGT